MSERLTDAELDAWAVRHKNAAAFFDFPYDEDYGMLRLLDQGKEANALAAEVERLKAENDAIKEALGVKDTEDGCCAPGEWCHYKTWTELALDYTNTIKDRDRLEREAAGLRAKAALADEMAVWMRAWEQCDRGDGGDDWLRRYDALRGAR